MNLRTRIIGLSGLKGAGKNHLATLLQNRLMRDGLSVEITAFANPLKEVAISGFGIPRELAYGDQAAKEQYSEWHWEDLSGHITGNYPDKRGPMTVREVLQLIGTDLVRDRWSMDTWIRMAKTNIRNSTADLMIFADARFPNEIRTIREIGGLLFRIQGASAGGHGCDHVSESSWAAEAYDLIVNNNMATDEELWAQVAPVLLKPEREAA